MPNSKLVGTLKQKSLYNCHILISEEKIANVCSVAKRFWLESNKFKALVASLALLVEVH
jgi:hypothetical protein